MEWPKVKNIIILILVMVDASLLVLVLGQQRAVDQYARSAVTRAVDVLARNGVAVADGALDDCGAMPPLACTRDIEAEAVIAHALLGEKAARQDRSGGLYVYESGTGTALFRVNGDFEARFTGGRPAAARELGDHAGDLMAAMGLEGEIAAAPEGRSGDVVVYQRVNGAPVYSCRLVFRYEEGELVSVAGTLLSGKTAPAADGGAALELPSALMRLLEGVLERGGVCSEITDLRPGYRVGQSFGAEMLLTPTWLVSTNAGSYYLDGVTGALTNAE